MCDIEDRRGRVAAELLRCRLPGRDEFGDLVGEQRRIARQYFRDGALGTSDRRGIEFRAGELDDQAVSTITSLDRVLLICGW